MQIRTHVLSQHSQRPREYLCPLCQENFNEKVKLEHHLVQVHNVTTEGMQRLLVMVDTPEWLSPQSANTQSSPTSSASATPDDIMPTGEAIKATDLAESELARLANDDGKLRIWILKNYSLKKVQNKFFYDFISYKYPCWFSVPSSVIATTRFKAIGVR